MMQNVKRAMDCHRLSIAHRVCMSKCRDRPIDPASDGHYCHTFRKIWTYVLEGGAIGVAVNVLTRATRTTTLASSLKRKWACGGWEKATISSFHCKCFLPWYQQDDVAEWLRRWIANPLGFARVSSNLTVVEFLFALNFEPCFCTCLSNWQSGGRWLFFFLNTGETQVLC